MVKKWIVYEKNAKGHRREYARLFAGILGCEYISGSGIKIILMLLRAPYVLFSSCDDYLFRFTFLSLIRDMLGKKTLAIAIRPESIYKKRSLKLLVKRMLYICLKKKPGVTILSILPFYCEPRLKGLVDEWIYDPQFWDQEVFFGRPDIKNIPEEFLSIPKKKKNIVLLGKLSVRKGTEFMIDIYVSSAKIRNNFNFILAGENYDIHEEKISVFTGQGGYYLDRRLSDSELLVMYDLSDIIWCCYPSYFNHSSGVFGRAIQFKRGVIIRKDSYLDKILIPDAIKCSIEYNDESKAEDDILGFNPSYEPDRLFLSSLEKLKRIADSI